MRGVDPELAATVRQMVQATARRWPRASADDLEGAAWVAALEAMQRYDAKHGPVRAYIGRTLKRVLPNEARRQISPVHLRRNREYEHSLADYVAVGAEVLDWSDSGAQPVDAALHSARFLADARAAVERATNDPTIRSVVLSGDEVRVWAVSMVPPAERVCWRAGVKKVYSAVASELAHYAP